MEEISPDVVLPLSSGLTGTRRETCVAYGASPEEILWLTAPESSAECSVFTKETAVRLHSFRAGLELTTHRYEGLQRPHFVQRMKTGLLFVHARQHDRAPNAWLMNDSMRIVRRLSLGDGLADVRVSPAGTIWAAYFDEGVFGSGDGSAGLVARDGFGRKVWTYDARKAGTDDIADVYAFNLAAENEAWLYFYTPFVLVRWRKKRPTVWQTRVQGARALAVRPAEALLFGDYEDPTSLRVLDLPALGGSARVKRRLRLRLPKGTDIRSIHALGAAHRLVLWSNRDLMIVERW